MYCGNIISSDRLQILERTVTGGRILGSSLLCLKGILHMSGLKPFLNYQDQIKNLTSKKGLIIGNLSFAEEKLSEICYYALIDGYKSIFYDYTTRTYLPDTTFEDIVNLYDFDEELRLRLFTCTVSHRKPRYSF